jgi:hypothetical protein
MLPCWCCLPEEVQQSSAPTALLPKRKQHRDSLRLQVWSNRHTTTSRSRVQVLPSPMKPGLQAHLWPSGMLVHVASLLQPPLLLPQWTTPANTNCVGMEVIAQRDAAHCCCPPA